SSRQSCRSPRRSTSRSRRRGRSENALCCGDGTRQSKPRGTTRRPDDVRTSEIFASALEKSRFRATGAESPKFGTLPRGDRPRTPKSASPQGSDASLVRCLLLLVATLVTSLTKQLAVLLLRHTLAALLDYRTHYLPHKVGGGRGCHGRQKKMPRDSLADPRGASSHADVGCDSARSDTPNRGRCCLYLPSFLLTA